MPVAAMPTRVPEIAEVYRPQQRTSYRLPLYLDRISAGFPSPADDYKASSTSTST